LCPSTLDVTEEWVDVAKGTSPCGLDRGFISQAAAESSERQTSWNSDDVDLDALAVKIIELMRRELRIELERRGRTR
jgi:hypothetical protein